MRRRNFTWDAWDYDYNGRSYVIAKDQCPEKENVPDFICREDSIPPECKPGMDVQEGWCRWEVRSDWEDYEGTPCGGYVVYPWKEPRSFPVWLVRQGDWY